MKSGSNYPSDRSEGEASIDDLRAALPETPETPERSVKSGGEASAWRAGCSCVTVSAAGELRRTPRRGLVSADRRCPGESAFFWLTMVRKGTGSILDGENRASTQLLTAGSKLLWCPSVEENAAICALFSRFPQRRRKSRTGWRRGGDSNPRDPFESTRVPGVRLKPGSATSPRANADYASRTAAEPVRLFARPINEAGMLQRRDENARGSGSAVRVFSRTRPIGGVWRRSRRTDVS